MLPALHTHTHTNVAKHAETCAAIHRLPARGSMNLSKIENCKMWQHIRRMHMHTTVRDLKHNTTKATDIRTHTRVGQLRKYENQNGVQGSYRTVVVVSRRYKLSIATNSHFQHVFASQRTTRTNLKSLSRFYCKFFEELQELFSTYIQSLRNGVDFLLVSSNVKSFRHRGHLVPKSYKIIFITESV